MVQNQEFVDCYAVASYNEVAVFVSIIFPVNMKTMLYFMYEK